MLLTEGTQKREMRILILVNQIWIQSFMCKIGVGSREFVEVYLLSQESAEGRMLNLRLGIFIQIEFFFRFDVILGL